MPRMTLWSMRITRWSHKATNTHFLEYVIFIAFIMQQWLHKRSSLLGCMYIACLVPFCTLHEDV
jgi:hypothetical protein